MDDEPWPRDKTTQRHGDRKDTNERTKATKTKGQQPDKRTSRKANGATATNSKGIKRDKQTSHNDKQAATKQRDKLRRCCAAQIRENRNWPDKRFSIKNNDSANT